MELNSSYNSNEMEIAYQQLILIILILWDQFGNNKSSLYHHQQTNQIKCVVTHAYCVLSLRFASSDCR